MIPEEISNYNLSLSESEKQICNLIAKLIQQELPYSKAKIWPAHPVWFINENPIVGYSKQKKGIRLMFWSGAGFEEDGLPVKGNKFKDASVFYNTLNDIQTQDLKRWLEKSITIQWDYKNIVKRKGKLIRLN